MRTALRLASRLRTRWAVALYTVTAVVGAVTVGAMITSEASPAPAGDLAAPPTTTTTAPETTTTTVPPTTSTTTQPVPTTTTTTAPDPARDAAIAAAGLIGEADLPNFVPNHEFDLGAHIFWSASSCVRPTLPMFTGVTAGDSSEFIEAADEHEDHTAAFVASATKVYKRVSLARAAVDHLGSDAFAACLRDAFAEREEDGTYFPTVERIDIDIEGTVAWRITMAEPGLPVELDFAAGFTGRGLAIAAVARGEGESGPWPIRDLVGRSLHRLHAALEG